MAYRIDDEHQNLEHLRDFLETSAAYLGVDMDILSQWDAPRDDSFLGRTSRGAGFGGVVCQPAVI